MTENIKPYRVSELNLQKISVACNIVPHFIYYNRNQYPKNDINRMIISQKVCCKKVKDQHV